MSLGDLHKKLYSKDEKIQERELASDAYDSSNYDQVETDFDRLDQEVVSAQKLAQEEERKISKSKKKFFLIAGAVLSLIVLFVAGSFLYSRILASYFNEERIVIEIEGAREVKNTLDSTYVIRIKNQNRIALSKVDLRLDYSDSMFIQAEDFLIPNGFNSSKVSIGEIGAYEEREIKTTFNFFGPQGKQAFLNATLSYQPANFSSFFQADTQKIVEISPSPLNVEIIGISEASSGELTEIEMLIDNETSEDQSDLVFQIDYPEGFFYQEAEPAPSKENNLWNFSNLESGSQIKVRLKGRITGQIDSLQRFKASLGKVNQQGDLLVFTESEQAIKVIPSRINIYQLVGNDSAYPGELLDYQVVFKNNSNIPLRDLILYSYIEGDMLIERSIKVNNGFYDSEKQVIVWRASDLPELKLLEPGQQGVASFSAELSGNAIIKGEDNFNQFIKSWSEIESLDVDSPIFENKSIRSQDKIVKINSNLYLQQFASHGEGEAFPSFGPSKLQSEKETSVTINYYLRNSTNNVSGTTITTALPTGIIWKGKVAPADANVEFNDRTNEIVWTVGDIKAGTGFLGDPISLSFQVGVKPSITQEKQSVVLVKGAKGIASDLFTGNKLGISFGSFETKDVTGLEDYGKVFPPEEAVTPETE